MKNPNAVALGSLTSERKSEAARANGAQGGRRKSRYQLEVRRMPHGKVWRVKFPVGHWQDFDMRTTATATLKALCAQERGQK